MKLKTLWGKGNRKGKSLGYALTCMDSSEVEIRHVLVWSLRNGLVTMRLDDGAICRMMWCDGSPYGITK
ncbi:hypothetical protein GJ744_005384 [Endocarpon pusillum]|uniref:Uncharacterized protein n=1 Tax=Endocarpon pusillum TaxID=364733 RepID=A0A8H7E7K7_9EURO|nr:hypothetical protein GJ744_005384 [Endocarpon pusillum]